MKRIILANYITILFLSVPLLLSAGDGKFKGRYTQEKTIKKEFDVNSDALLKISNSYGNLNLTSWDGNTVLIEVHIKTNGNNEEKVRKKLDEITVDFDASSSLVSAKTIFRKETNGWSWWGGGNTNITMQINYTIKLPVKNSIHLNNTYGSIILDRIDGHAKINCDYGRLEIGELRGRKNQLNFDYTSKSTIEFINSGTINADYSDFTIEKAGDLIIEADYTKSTVEKMNNLQYNTDYGRLEIGEANNVQGTGDYIGVKMGTMHGNVDITADYGSVKINTMAEDAGNLLINGDYTGIKIGYDPAYHFNFEIRTSHGSVNGIADFQTNISEVKNTSKYFKGHYGSNTSKKSVDISSDYGGVTFTKN